MRITWSSNERIDNANRINATEEGGGGGRRCCCCSERQLIDTLSHLFPQLLHASSILLELLQPHILHWGLPPEARAPLALQRLPLPPLGLHLVQQLHVLLVELLQGCGPVAVVRGNVNDRCGRGGEEAVDDGIDAWVAKGESLAGGGEDDDGNLSAAEDAELTGLLEEACTALREADLT